ncbi:unnamed protein product [Caenorhabditis auriculariae]|uniref:Uncharacterized protein n=1 Tax=Caenorhabditis auriculariae TaxID=2777116 RepID=A0A8S1GX91_9PELO|nr:unnamed protein product [Caenorhabditis auriculariae]
MCGGPRENRLGERPSTTFLSVVLDVPFSNTCLALEQSRRKDLLWKRGGSACALVGKRAAFQRSSVAKGICRRAWSLAAGYSHCRRFFRVSNAHVWRLAYSVPWIKFEREREAEPTKGLFGKKY